MSKQHRTAMGQSIDMDSLRAKNEHVRAVGNIPVNARGDTIDSRGRVIETATAKLSRSHKNTTQAIRAPQKQEPKIKPEEFTINDIDAALFDEPNPDKGE
jgi:hypothetical protein